MFKFPCGDKDRLQLWIQNSGNPKLGLLSKEKLKSRFVCKKHFLKSSIHYGPQKTRLIGPANPVHYQAPDIEGTSHSVDDGTSASDSIEQLKVKMPTKFYLKKSVIKPLNHEEQSVVSSSIESTLQEQSVLSSIESTPPILLCTPIDNTVLKPQQLNGGVTKRSSNTMVRQIKALRSKVFRLKKKLQTPKIPYKSKASETIAKMQTRNMSKKKKRWSEDEKAFCISLYNESPAAYKFLKEQGVVLAALSTMYHWLNKTKSSNQATQAASQEENTSNTQEKEDNRADTSFCINPGGQKVTVVKSISNKPQKRPLFADPDPEVIESEKHARLGDDDEEEMDDSDDDESDIDMKLEQEDECIVKTEHDSDSDDPLRLIR